MTVLLVHNHYQRPGGEDQVFAAEAALLERFGERVVTYTVHNDRVADLGRLELASTMFWNGAAYHDLRRLIQEERPRVVHVHNAFPLISPAVYDAAQDEDRPVVQTLHNYRMLCPGALFARAGRTCESCLGRSIPWEGIRHGCYRGSRSATAAVAAMLVYHRARQTWTRKVDRYVALSDFARRRFVAGGLPAEKIVVKPNFVDPVPAPGAHDGSYLVFIGRLSEEKGLRTLLRAWTGVSGLSLRLIGDGPLRAELEAEVGRLSLGDRVRFLGWRGRDAVLSELRGAAALVFPSECYEGFPVAIAEAFACGAPVLASRLGAMAEIVEDGETGVLFPPGDPEGLAAAVNAAVARPRELRRMGRRAREVFEAEYTAERNYQRLLAIYESVRRGKG